MYYLNNKTLFAARDLLVACPMCLFSSDNSIYHSAILDVSFRASLRPLSGISVNKLPDSAKTPYLRQAYRNHNL